MAAHVWAAIRVGEQEESWGEDAHAAHEGLGAVTIEGAGVAGWPLTPSRDTGAVCAYSSFWR
jgi:hypothetical protein